MRSRYLAAAVLLVAGCTSSSHHNGPSSVAPTSAPVPGGVSSSAISSSAPSPITAADWPTYHGTPDRAGVSTTMPATTSAPKVLVKVALDAALYASPIVVDGIVVVVTENDSVYGLSTDGHVLWHQRFGSPARSSNLPCGNIDPSGMTGTPVYSAATGLVYVVAEHDGPVRHDVIALDLHTGREAWTRSLSLPGTSQNAMQQRGALNLADGRVWIAFGGRAGDCGDYKGQVVGVPQDNGGNDVIFTVPTQREAGIWTPPGPTVDSHGHLYVAVGNGESGVGDPYDDSDSVLELDGTAHQISSFSPATWPTDNAMDLDLGSQGPALVGSFVFQAGKSGTAYVLHRDALGGIGGEVSQTHVPCHSFGGTSVEGDVVFVPCREGDTAIHIDGAGRLTTLWRRDGVTGSPVIGGGRIWTLDTDHGILHELDPTSGTSTGEVAVGQVTRFATPALYRNLVLVPTMSGLTIVTA